MFQPLEGDLLCLRAHGCQREGEPPQLGAVRGDAAAPEEPAGVQRVTRLRHELRLRESRKTVLMVRVCVCVCVCVLFVD